MMNAASQITSRLLRNIKSGNITRGSAVLAGIASRRTVPFGALVLCNRDAAVAEMLPTAVIRSSVPCCSSSADLDVVELQLKVDGMVCDGCTSRVLEALQKCAGVKAVEVDLEKGLATVQVEAATQVDAFNALPGLIQTVTELGFEAQPHFE